MTGLVVKQPGVLSLLQDNGRFGFHRLGLTNGGPLDAGAFNWANRLCENSPGTTALELTVGGLVVEVQQPVRLAVTGANADLSINGNAVDMWRTHCLEPGDSLKVGYASQGLRLYLAVTGGFSVEPQFGSTATVVREGVGGLCGRSLEAGDRLHCEAFEASDSSSNWRLESGLRPRYRQEATLRMVPGYQQAQFSEESRARFFSSEYEVTNQSDRMGYRLKGPVITAQVDGVLSEGICHGAVQVPPDGQPIVLLNDRQTIGGYPKIGSVLALDTARLAQLRAGARVRFEAVSIDEARKINAAAYRRFMAIKPEPC
jgi:biotin-dependent carboxylase-like uncharacterized protein